MKRIISTIALVCIMASPACCREITTEDMKQIMQDTNCLVVELEETKKSLATERQETDKYIALAEELNAGNKKLREASTSKRWGGIALGAVIGLTIGLVAR